MANHPNPTSNSLAQQSSVIHGRRDVFQLPGLHLSPSQDVPRVTKPTISPASSPSQYLQTVSSPQAANRDHHPGLQKSSSDIQDFLQAASQHLQRLGPDTAPPPPSGQGTLANISARMQHEPQSIVSESGELYTLEEWDAKYPVPKAESTSSKLGKPPITVPLPAVQTTGETTARFNNLCQLHSIIPVYTIEEVAQGCFSAKVEFGGTVCEDKGPFPSKKQAKDVLCRQACEMIEGRAMPMKGKRKSHDEVALLEEENWIGQLVEFCQKQKHPQPAYQAYEAEDVESQRKGLTLNSKSFACTVRVQAAPGQVFGSEEKLFSSKAQAKRNAAKEAIFWLRANGLPSTGPSSKRSKSNDDGESTGLTQQLTKLNTNQSLPQMVHERSNQLGFSQPAFECRPATPPPGAIAPNFYTASARYLDRDVEKDPRLKGSLCTTGNIYGQKNAKEECCRILLAMLEGMYQEKLNATRQS